MRLYVVLFLALVLAACASQPNKERAVPAPGSFLLGDLYPVYVSASAEIANVSTNELIKTYRDLLPHIDDEAQRADVLQRIGDLETRLQDQLAERSEKSGGEAYLPNYSAAIDTYRQLLREYPERQNDQVYYQLAKDYTLSADAGNAYLALTELVNRYPQSMYYLEAQFRRGDYLYGSAEFKMAQDAYGAVVEGGENTPFYENALYMHGWTLFKRSFYEPALTSFTKLLDRTMPASGDIEQVDKNQLSLVEDSLRIMSMIFSYMDGGQTIAETYQRLGSRPYEGLLYERLGDLYVSKQRYQDGIDTYGMFVERQPMSDQAPVLANKVLTTMLRAGFFHQAFLEKEKFVKNYSINSDYFLAASVKRQQYIREYLYVYTDEIGRFYHARGQQEKRQLTRYKEAPAGKKADMLADFKEATVYYGEFIAAFPDDIHAPEKSFLMAEAYSEMGEYGEAIKAYERTAYEFPINLFSEDAAYNAIIAYGKLIERQADDAQKQELVHKRLQTQLLFVDNFSFSPYAKPVLLDSIDLVYKEKDYQTAIKQSERFLALKPAGTEKEQQVVNLVMAHSYFALNDFVNAEKFYQQTLALTDEKDSKQRAEITDRMAASVYKHAESMVAAGQQEEAVAEFLRVAKVAPTSKFRKNAEFDAATYLLIGKKWQQALDVLTDYRARYDAKQQDLEVTGKVLAAYEGLEQYGKAADELMKVSRQTPDANKRRETLYLAATYYEKDGNDEKAMQLYKDYAHLYPTPFDLAIEVQFKLSEMYKKADDDYRRRYWLDKIIISDRDAGANRSDRSRYLAAFARNVFAEDHRLAFEKIKLTLPLRASLQAKQKEMKEALTRYQQVIDYGVQEFTTQALYYVGSIYAQMGQDLIHSDRPKDLDELELEQYEMLLEEQADPFIVTAIDVQESNVKNGWAGNFNQWVAKSIAALAKLMPGRYDKQEKAGEYSREIY